MDHDEGARKKDDDVAGPVTGDNSRRVIKSSECVTIITPRMNVSIILVRKVG